MAQPLRPGPAFPADSKQDPRPPGAPPQEALLGGFLSVGAPSFGDMGVRACTMAGLLIWLCVSTCFLTF